MGRGNKYEISDIVLYSQESGNLFWRESRGRVRALDIAGTIFYPKNTKIKYIVVTINRKHYLAHRLSWFLFYGYWPDQIDHIDGDGLNNKIENLRDVTNLENRKNMRVQYRNKLNLCGVSYLEKTNNFRVRISIDRKEMHIGTYETIFEAACARKSAENKYNFHENHGSIR